MDLPSMMNQQAWTAPWRSRPAARPSCATRRPRGTVPEGGLNMEGKTAATLIAWSWLAFTSPAQGEGAPGHQAKAPAAVQAVAGEWQSVERFDGQPRVTLVVKD